MTEAEWQASDKPLEIIRWLLDGRFVSWRKCRLFAYACCDCIADLCHQEGCHESLQAVELYAEGRAGIDQVNHAHEAASLAAEQVCSRLPYPDYMTLAGHYATYAAYWATRYCDDQALSVAWWVPRAIARKTIGSPRNLTPEQLAILQRVEGDEEARLAKLFRDVFGNPFRTVEINPAWLTSTVTQLAETIYADRSFDCLPILADALEEAGCTDADILNHCRQPGEHVRGCWVVDLLLGKA